MHKVLGRKFFERPALVVAPDLLGKVLVRKRNGKEHPFIITEVEAYIGQEDKACHAHKGLTKRTEVMFGPAGYFYVYLVYGMYFMLNIVTDKEDHPSAVLIRGVKEHSKILENVRMFDGPGKLTRELRINKSFNGKKTAKETGLWIEDRGIKISNTSIKKTPRIGVDYAGEWARKPYRFVLK